MTNEAITTPKEVGTPQIVELIAGPCCGMKVNWPEDSEFATVKYTFGYSVYKLTTKEKARYSHG